MNVRRLALAAVVAWIVDIVFGFVVHGQLMSDLFAQHPDVFRAQADMNLPLGFGASLVGMFLFAYIYSKGYEGGRGMQEGMRFGALVGLLMVAFDSTWGYVMLRESRRLAASGALAMLVEFTIAGTIVGALYAPLTAPRSAANKAAAA